MGHMNFKFTLTGLAALLAASALSPAANAAGFLFKNNLYRAWALPLPDKPRRCAIPPLFLSIPQAWPNLTGQALTLERTLFSP